MSFYDLLCGSKASFFGGIAGIAVGFLLLILLLALVIVCLCVDVRRRKAKLQQETHENEKLRKLANDGLERVLIYLAFMGQKGHYKTPKNKFPADKCKQVLMEPVWDDNRRQALMDVAKFYDTSATEKELDDPNSPYYPMARKVTGKGAGGESVQSGNLSSSGSRRGR